MDVLSSLTAGDLQVSMPSRGMLQSENDEAGKLNASLETYRGHLLEIQSIRSAQSQKRQHRDRIVLDKMASLSMQLQG